jgi:hypothetical protein
MKKLLLLLLLPVLMTGQSVPSSCTAHDSITSIYKKDADRLALRRTYYMNYTYKDSIQINPTQKSMYLKYLLAVYNATALPIRDTIIKMFNIHTNPEPDLNYFTIKANPAYQWVQNIQNNIYPTGQATVDYLMTKYSLHESGYYQSQGYDLIRFRADTNYNLLPLANSFTAIAGVSDADVESSYDDTRNITDSINTAFGILNYSYGWGTCNNGCDYRKTWSFKIFPDCSVEYLGSTGDPLFLSVQEQMTGLQKNVYPNPFNNRLIIEVSPGNNTVQFELINTLGQIIKSWESPEKTLELETSSLPQGLYYLKMSDGSRTGLIKLVRE